MTAPAVAGGARHRMVPMVRPATRTAWVLCVGCEWALVVDYVHDDEAMVAIRKCEAAGLRHENTVLRWLGAAIRRTARFLGITS